MLDLTYMNVVVLDLLDITCMFMIKCLDTLDLGECCDVLFHLRSRYRLENDELTMLSALLIIIIIDPCPS
jgi:hypothetical protein